MRPDANCLLSVRGAGAYCCDRLQSRTLSTRCLIRPVELQLNLRCGKLRKRRKAVSAGPSPCSAALPWRSVSGSSSYLRNYPLPIHALGEAIGGTDPKTLETFMDLVNGWLSTRLAEGLQGKGQLMHLAETWEKVNRAAREAEAYNLERKPLVFSVFGALAEAAAGD